MDQAPPLTFDMFQTAAARFSQAEAEVIEIWRSKAACNCSSPGELEKCWECPYHKQLGRLIQKKLHSQPEKVFAKIPPPKLSDPYSPKVKELCCEMYSCGYSIKEIQELVGVPLRKELRKWLREEGLQARSANYPEHIKQKCLDLYAEGWTVRQIEDEVGVPADTVTDWAYIENLSRKRKYPDQIQQQCLQLYQAGHTSEDIHKMLGIPVVTIKTWIAKAGIGRKRKRYSKREQDKYLQLYLEGKSPREIEAMHGVKATTLRSWIRKMDLASNVSDIHRKEILNRSKRLYENKQRNNLWKNIKNLAQEIRSINEARGEINYIPSANVLRELDRGDLVYAITRYHGGFQSVAEYMGIGFRKRRSRYWHDFENLKQELFLYIREFGTAGIMPTKAELEEAGKAALSAALSIHGGVVEVARRLNLQFSYDRKPRSYWKNLNHLKGAIEEVSQQLRIQNRLPTHEELQELGRTDLISAIAKNGGWPSVSRRLGFSYSRKKVSSSEDTETSSSVKSDR